MAVELLGVGVAPRHHRRPFGDAQIGLPQPHAMLHGQAVQALDRRVQQLGIGREGDGLGLHRGVDRDPRQVLGPQRTASCATRRLSASSSSSLSPRRFLQWLRSERSCGKRVLEELLPGEELEIGVMHPALAHAFVGQPE